MTTCPVTAAMELDAFDFDDDSTTMTSVEQSKTVEVVMWNYHDEREVGRYQKCITKEKYSTETKFM